MCWQDPEISWDIKKTLEGNELPIHIFNTVDEILQYVTTHAQPNSHIVIMSNKGFSGIHQRLLTRLKNHIDDVVVEG